MTVSASNRLGAAEPSASLRAGSPDRREVFFNGRTLALGAGEEFTPGGKASSSFARTDLSAQAEDRSTMQTSIRMVLEYTSSPHEDFSGLGAICWPNHPPHLHGLNEAGGTVIADFKAAL